MLGPRECLWVNDWRTTRISVFDPTEGFVVSFRYENSLAGWRLAAIDPDGCIFLRDADSVRIYDAAMTEIDVAPLPAVRDGGLTLDSDPALFYEEFDGSFHYEFVPFYPLGTSFLDAAGGSFWYTVQGDPAYRIWKHSLSGGMTTEAVVERPGIPVTQAERDSAINVLRENTGRDLDWSRIPDTRKPVRIIFASAAGNLWVNTVLPGFGSSFDVLAPDGALGAATADFAVSPFVKPVVRGDSFWAVVTDDLGIQYVVRARIDGPQETRT